VNVALIWPATHQIGVISARFFFLVKMIRSAEFNNSKDPLANVTESYYLETRDGLFFAVKGLEQPPDRWIAVLRYARDSEKGNRRKEGRLYRRLYHFWEQEHFIKATCPWYLAFDPVFQMKLQSVPRSRMLRVYDPHLRLQELLQASDNGGIEKDAVDFVRLLQKEAQVPIPVFGITGSLLIGLHTQHSDLDVVVFGIRNCRKVHGVLQSLLDAGSCPELRRLDRRGLKELYEQRVVDTQMAFDEFMGLEMRKVNQGSYRRRPYFIRFVPDTHEKRESYGHRQYTPLGQATIQAMINDAEESIFTPCRYRLSGVSFLKGPQAPDLNEIVSFRGRFCEQALTGESIVAAGTLERVLDEGGNILHRLLLGNCPEDTMVVRV
jgi:predicted nucleotidyltransferase